MTNIVLNSPVCRDCSDYGYTAGGGAPSGTVPMGPGVVIMDRGKISLTAGVARAVAFSQISVIDATKWAFAGLPVCYDATEEVEYQITNKTGTGFTVTAAKDSTFEYAAVKL